METIGPPARRNATGPLRDLVWVRELPHPTPRGHFRAYAVPTALLALPGLGLAAGEYLLGNRPLHALVAWLLAAGSVPPVAGREYYLVVGSATLRAVSDIALSGGPRHERPGRVS